MPNIEVLDQSTINKIAAGEVIERPASVVKELLENAIDAGATAVTVEIREGGIAFIRVTDNGCGIRREELPLAFLRHSTSKIKAVEDLFTISSLGFRGEALSSIAAVSQVEVITKTSGSLTGTRYQIEGGQEKGAEEIGAPEGTTFIARNLFYNTPVRRKFLKTPMTEGAHVADLVEKISLSHPEISIRFIQNNQNKLHTSGNHNLKDMIYTVYGREVASNLLPVSFQSEMVSVTGFVGKPVISKSNRTFENYFINGRYVRNAVIGKAIEEAYKPFMMQHRYPFALLHFSIEPEFLDINVHPTKMELRFRDGELVYKAVRDSIAAALEQKELIPAVSLDQKAEMPKEQPKEQSRAEKRIPIPEPFEIKRREQLLVREPEPDYGKNIHGTHLAFAPSREVAAVTPVSPAVSSAPAKPAVSAAPAKPAGSEEVVASGVSPQAGTVSQTQMDLFEEKLLEPKARVRHKLIGQLFDTYWLVEFSGHLYIIDQHAAHEKVLYEKTMASLTTRENTCQMVNPPIILSLSSQESVLVEKYMGSFHAIGFELEHFGGKEYAVRGVPGNLFSIAKKELLMEMIDGLSEDTSVTNPQLLYEKIASMSCKAAVKGNHSMSFQEADHLIDQLLDLENPYACPHGRPTIISMSKQELEKKFKRIL